MAVIIVVALVAAWLFIVTPMNFIIRIIIIALLAFMAIIWLAKFNRFNGNKKIDWGQSRVDGIMFTAGVIIITLIIDLF